MFQNDISKLCEILKGGGGLYILANIIQCELRFKISKPNVYNFLEIKNTP